MKPRVQAFRAQLSAAPLKPVLSGRVLVGKTNLPRSIERGPVEACRCRLARLAVSRLPRSIERGPVEACTPKPGRAGKPSRHFRLTGLAQHNTLQATSLRRNPAGSLPGANHAVVPKPIDEANRCILRHAMPKALQKALYVGLSQFGRPQRVVCLGGSRFPIPKASLAGAIPLPDDPTGIGARPLGCRKRKLEQGLATYLRRRGSVLLQPEGRAPMPWWHLQDASQRGQTHTKV